MGIITRFKDIMSANINAMLDKAEDPEKMIDQYMRNLESDLGKVKAETAAVMADVKMAEKKLQECDADIARKQKAAENALKAGNEADARTLLAAKQTMEVTRESLLQNLAVAQKNADMMQEGYNRLVRNIEELESRKDAAKAKIAMAKAQERADEQLRRKLARMEKRGIYLEMADSATLAQVDSILKAEFEE